MATKEQTTGRHQKVVAAVEADLEANDAKLIAEEKRASDTARYEALAREHGADLSEEQFNAALGKVARRKSSEAADGSPKQK